MLSTITTNTKQLSLSLLHPHRITLTRTFINARIKWVKDPFLDYVVEREKNLLPCLSLKNLILSSPSLSLPISIASLHKPRLNLPTTAISFILKYPSLFHTFPPHNVKVTPDFLALHREEQEIHDSMVQREMAALRLLKLLMLTKACRVPVKLIDDLRFDLGLPENYILELVSWFPEYFRVCSDLGCDKFRNGVVGDDENGGVVENFGGVVLELVKWRKELAVPAILNKEGEFGDDLGYQKGRIVKFPLSFAPGFDLQRRVREWVEEWQELPYISPYEDAFHLAPGSDQSEKYTVAVLHEILCLLVSKKTEVKNVVRLGNYLGFGMRFKKALVHHPGMFYLSNKLRTQTVVLREAFRKDVLLEKHPLMGMRHRYIYLMNKSKKRKTLFDFSPGGSTLQTTGAAGSIEEREYG